MKPIELQTHTKRTAYATSDRLSIRYDSAAPSQFQITERPFSSGSVGLDSDRVWSMDAAQFERLFELMQGMYGTLNRAGLIGPQPATKKSP